MQLSPQQLVLYETARALVESPTLEEAAPRMVAAVCQAFGWQCGGKTAPGSRRHSTMKNGLPRKLMPKLTGGSSVP